MAGKEQGILLFSFCLLVGEFETNRIFGTSRHGKKQHCRSALLQRSHLRDPERLDRFLMATCLAYIWMIYLGVKVHKNKADLRLFHRADRCDLSLFQLGLCYLKYLLNQERAPPVKSQLKSVR